MTWPEPIADLAIRLGWARSPVRREILAALGATVVLVGVSFGANARLDAPRRLDLLGVLLVVVAGVCLAGVRSAPVPAIMVAAGTVTSYLALGYPYGPIEISVVVLMVAVARTRPLTTSGLVCLIVGLAATASVLARLADNTIPRVVVAVIWVSWLVIPWLLGSVLRMRAEAASRTREELVAIVTARERMRVAREVHDIAGHGFAVVAMQAGVALISFDDDPAQARTSLEAIQAVSGRGLADLRAMLGMFHPPAGTVPVRRTPTAQPAEPRRGLTDLCSLLDDASTDGLVITRRLADVGELSSDLQHVLYRVVQESLTNVVKHAHADRVEVSLTREGDSVVVRIDDSGVGGEFTPGAGITGMGQRVSAAGGRLRAAPASGGGFEVEAVLPIRRRSTGDGGAGDGNGGDVDDD